MAESSLSVAYAELRRHLGRHLGWHRDPANWTANQILDGGDFLRDGLRRFYEAHDWHFLRPVTSFSTVAAYTTGTIEIAAGVVTLTGGTFPAWAAAGELQTRGQTYEVASRDGNTQLTLADTSVDVAAGATFSLFRWAYDLPDEFADFDGPITFRPSQLGPAMSLVSEDMIRRRRQAGDETGRPRWAAWRPKASTGASGQRFELLLWPMADGVYELTYRYRAQPNELTADNPYPLGGAGHARTIIEAVLAAAELAANDEQGIHELAFQRELAKSIEKDRRLAAATLGGDPTGERPSGDCRPLPNDLCEYEGHTLFFPP